MKKIKNRTLQEPLDEAFVDTVKKGLAATAFMAGIGAAPTASPQKDINTPQNYTKLRNYPDKYKSNNLDDKRKISFYQNQSSKAGKELLNLLNIHIMNLEDMKIHFQNLIQENNELLKTGHKDLVISKKSFLLLKKYHDLNDYETYNKIIEKIDAEFKSNLDSLDNFENFDN
jgi:hypothetical protein